MNGGLSHVNCYDDNQLYGSREALSMMARGRYANKPNKGSTTNKVDLDRTDLRL